MAPAETTCCGLNAHAGKRHKGPAMPHFPGFDLCPEDSAHTDGQPYNSTESVSCGSLAPEDAQRRISASESECGPQLLLRQQQPSDMKSCELSWLALTASQLQLPRSKANSVERHGHGLSLPRAQAG